MLYWLLVPLLAVLPLAPSATPSASPDSGSGLKEIAHVRSSACQTLVNTANAVIDVAMQNDATLLQTIRALHTTRLNGNEIERQNSLRQLSDLAKAIDQQASAGNKQVKALRKIAAATTDPKKQQELLAFANALGGAIGRQDSISRDVSGFVSNLETRDMNIGDDARRNMDIIGNELPTAPPGSVRPAYLPDDDGMAASMATDFISRLHDIRADETTATSHADGATSGC